MAAVLASVSYTIQDSEKVKTAKQLFFVFDDAKTFANIQAFVDALTPILDAVTEGEIINITTRVIMNITGAKGAPVADSDVQETLLLSFLATGTPYAWGDDIPALIDAAVVNGRIDLANAAVAAYTAFAIAAHSGFAMSTRNGNDLIAVKSGAETFRKYRKQLNKLSKTTA